MSVYFIADKNGCVKIGRSRDVESRLAGLQTAASGPLTIVRIIGGAGHATETWLHRRFAAHHVNGEWFRLTDEMLSIVVPDELPPKPPYFSIKRTIDDAYQRNEITAEQRRELLEEHKKLCS